MSPWRGSGPPPPGFGRILGRFLLAWVVASAAGALLQYLFWFLLLSNPLPEVYGPAFFGLRHELDTLLPVVCLSSLAYVLLVGAAAALLCVRLLHRIAGPIFKLERVLGNYLEGYPVRPLFFRRGDFVPGLSPAFNGFVGRLREDRQAWMGLMENAERLCLRGKDTCRAEMEKALSDLKTLLDRYR